MRFFDERGRMKLLSTFLSLLLTPLVAVMPLQAEMTSVSGAIAPAAEGSIPGGTTPSAQPTLQIRLADSGQVTVQASSSLKGYSIVVTDSAGLPVSEVAVAIRLPDEGATGFFTDGAHSAVAYTDVTGIARFAQVNWGATPGIVAIRVTAAKGDLHAGVLIEQTILPPTSPTPIVQVSKAALTSPAPPPVSVSVMNTKVNPAPGTPASVDSVHSGASAEQPAIRTTETAASAEPVVSIVNTAGNKGGSHGSNKKWILLAVVAVGAGVGAAMAMSGKGGASAATASTGVSIGTPTISVGH